MAANIIDGVAAVDSNAIRVAHLYVLRLLSGDERYAEVSILYNDGGFRVHGSHNQDRDIFSQLIVESVDCMKNHCKDIILTHDGRLVGARRCGVVVALANVDVGDFGW